MDFKKIISLVMGCISFFLLRDMIFSYDNKKAHPSINGAIVQFAEKNSASIFPQNYVVRISAETNKYPGPAVTNAGFFENTTAESEVEFTIYEWINHGGFSADEPELAAAVRHFYDPMGIRFGKKFLTNRGTYWEGVYANPQTDAIEWSLGDTEKGAANKWTLQKGKEYMTAALELAPDNMKASNLAKAFRCLGEVLHNTGDMGCPPHTRNDSHAAPLGYTGGYILGSPDPYEEMFRPEWAQVYMESEPDPALKSFFESAATIRSIQEKLAEFTNENFFTEQTINGIGAGNYNPINGGDGKYPSPLLQELEYNTGDFTFYKTFPSGHKVKMCKDKGYFSSRTYPYIDWSCVFSQADELVPDILCAGANVIRLFIPKLEVKIKEAKEDGIVTGTVDHIANTEYSSEIAYSGKIKIYNAGTEMEIGEVDCNTGDFSGSLAPFSKDTEIYAALEIAGISIRSSKYKVSTKFLTIDPADFNAVQYGQYILTARYNSVLPSEYFCDWFVLDTDHGLMRNENTMKLKYRFKKEGTFDIQVSLFDKSNTYSPVATAYTKVTVTKGVLSDLYQQEGFSLNLYASCEYDSLESSTFNFTTRNFYYQGFKLEWTGTSFSVVYDFLDPGTTVADTQFVSGDLSGIVSEDGKTLLSLSYEQHVTDKDTPWNYDFKIEVTDIPLEVQNVWELTNVTGYLKGSLLQDHIKTITFKKVYKEDYTGKWRTATLKSLHYDNPEPELRLFFE